jgi:hypothetical protein
MFFMMLIIVSCSGEGEEKTVPETPINPAEKLYTISPVATADFYYFTDSGYLYKFSESGIVETITIQVTIKQENEIDVVQALEIDQFFRIGMTIYFSGSADGKFLY